MKPTLYVYKPIGATPLEIITAIKKQYPEYEKETLAYAGRLDPMAEGLLLILVGDENKNRKQYEDLPKTYECDVLCGIETDTYDVLGKIIESNNKHPDLEEIKQAVQSFVGKQTQPYPPYSSQPVNGKPLYYWARENKLHEITIPTKDIEIYNIETLQARTIKTSELKTLIHERIANVHGDFRQAEILALWNEFFTKHTNESFPIYSFHITCSSGTYIRSFAHKLGKKLHTSALALSIKRTQIGDHSLQDAIKLGIL